MQGQSNTAQPPPCHGAPAIGPAPRRSRPPEVAGEDVGRSVQDRWGLRGINVTAFPRLLFFRDYAEEFDVTEDGRFVMITAPENDSTEAGGDGEPESEHRTILVVNWLGGVKARLEEGGNR